MAKATLGQYLREAREEKTLSQVAASKEAVREARRRKWPLKVPASLIGAYETDTVDRPDPKVLRVLAEIYGRDYLQLMVHVVFDRYGASEEFEARGDGPLAEARREVWESVLLAHNEPVAGVESKSLEVAQLRAKAEVVREHVVLDIDGMVEWESNCWQSTPAEHKKFWVVIPKPAAVRDDRIRDAVVSMVRQGVEITYFVPKTTDPDPFGVDQLRDEVAEILKLTPARAASAIRRVGLSADQQALMATTDIVIAKPLGNAMGFASIRRNGSPVFCIMLDKQETRSIARLLNRIAEHTHDESVPTVRPPPRTKGKR